MYMGRPYYPLWLDNLADDVTGEGAAMQGVARGAKAVRAIVVAAREEYKDQVFSFTGDYGDNGFIEEYTCEIRGEPTRVVVTVARNAEGKTQHLVVNHRPRSSVMLFARLMGEKFADTPLAELFITKENENVNQAARCWSPHRYSRSPAAQLRREPFRQVQRRRRAARIASRSSARNWATTNSLASLKTCSTALRPLANP